MRRLFQHLRDRVARLRRAIAHRLRRLAARIDAPDAAAKSQGVVS